MRKLLFLMLLLAAVGGSGCSSARYVQRGEDEGVIAVADRSNSWPSYNYDKALSLIVDHVGDEFEIVEEWSEKTGESVLKEHQANPQVGVVAGNNGFGGGQGFGDQQSSIVPNDSFIEQTIRSTDITEWRIRYRRVSGGQGNPEGQPNEIKSN